MKIVLVLAALVAFAAAVPFKSNVATKSVDAEFVARQKKVLSFFHFVHQESLEAEYYKIGKEYSIQANIDHYSNKHAVEEFLYLYNEGFVPKTNVFTIFNEKMREEAIATFYLFYYAKDFETFYKTAAWARVHFENKGLFYYSFYIAVLQRSDTQGIVLPAPYELYPEFFVNQEYAFYVQGTKMQHDKSEFMELWNKYGIFKENDNFVYYANYSNSLTYPNEEHKISYFVEDIGWNAMYYYFHVHYPFWFSGEHYGPLKERRGEVFYYFYQQLLARYYLERYANGMSDIPEFSWNLPVKSGYYPQLAAQYTPFAQRNNYYHVDNYKNADFIQYLKMYETSFLQYLEKSHFKAYDQEVDLHSWKAINFVGDYWETNVDLHEKIGFSHFNRSYMTIARELISGAPQQAGEYEFIPSALDFYQTSLRDPAFYQLYKHILDYIVHFKHYLGPYSAHDLSFQGVKINDVSVDKLVTYFDFFDFDATNLVYYNEKELKEPFTWGYKIRQPRLNHKPFTVSVNVHSEAESQAVFRIMLGPKYDENGYPINIEEYWTKFITLDVFVHQLAKGENKIERSSGDFVHFKDDSVPVEELYKYLDQGKVPEGMSESFYLKPKRLMLPRGSFDGFPFQLFVFVYPYQPLEKSYSQLTFVKDNKPFGYPFDRPAAKYYYKQPNMFFKDVSIFHEGKYFPYQYNTQYFFSHQNAVPKH